MKIQTKTAILFTLITALLVGVISLTSYILTNNFVNKDFLKRLEIRTIIASKVVLEHDHVATNSLEELRRDHLEYLPHEKQYLIKADTLHKVQFLPRSYLEEILAANGSTAFYHAGITDYAGIAHKDEKGEYLVIKSAVNEYGLSTLAKLRDIKLISFFGGLVLVYTVSIFFARKTFQPVRQIIQQSRNISAFNLNRRLPEPSGADEIAEMSKTFNNMLYRLQAAFETQNNFISNASHELRTPLTTIIGEADWALQKERDTAAYKQTLTEIQRQADHLNKITSALLKMAQSSFDGQKQEWAAIDLFDLIYEAIHAVQKLNGNNEFILEGAMAEENAQPFQVMGNRNLLLLALGNILSNAIKYSNHDKITVVVETMAGTCSIQVRDQGIGIPDEDLPHVFEPFFRASNSKKFEGFGVGLPLAMNIARIHQGTIKVDSLEGKGTRVSLILPLI